MKASAVLTVALALAGCATTAPPDLVEDLQAVGNLPVGRVVKVEKRTYGGTRSDAGTAGAAAVGGPGGAALAGGIAEALSRDTRFIHEVRTASGEVFSEMSKFEFPVGTCVSIGANNTQHVSILARSNRCAPVR